MSACHYALEGSGIKVMVRCADKATYSQPIES